jgi:hypothetical protein
MISKTENDPRYFARTYLQVRSNLVAILGPVGLEKNLPRFMETASKDETANAAFIDHVKQRYPNNMAAVHFASLAYRNKFLRKPPTEREYKNLITQIFSQRSEKASRKLEANWPFYGWNPSYLIANIPHAQGQEFGYVPGDETFWASAWWNSSSQEDYLAHCADFFELSFEGESSAVHEIRLKRSYHTRKERIAGIPSFLEKLDIVLRSAFPKIPLEQIRDPLIQSIEKLHEESLVRGTYGFRTKFYEQPVDDSVLRVNSQFDIEIILEHKSRYPVLEGIGVIFVGVLLAPFWLPFRLAGKI